MGKKIKIVALLPLLKFGLPQSEDQTVLLEKKQAEEIIESGYAKLYVASKTDSKIETENQDDQEEESENDDSENQEEETESSK